MQVQRLLNAPTTNEPARAVRSRRFRPKTVKPKKGKGAYKRRKDVPDLRIHETEPGPSNS